MNTYELLIVFTDGETKTINEVSEHRYNTDTGLFSFVKNGYRSFLPKENMKYFGRKFDWEEKT